MDVGFLRASEGLSRIRVFGFWPAAQDPFADHFTIWVHEFLGDDLEGESRFRAVPMAGLKPANLEFHGEGRTLEEALAKAISPMRGKSMKEIFFPPAE
ncbi:MAG: hypothetical protein ACE5IQ_01540 [Candidatus Methylomirabilales bacterium]